jgi:hypothetical protein
MAAYHAKQNRVGLRRLGIIECALALSVIIGFGFVSLRIMSMPVAANQTADAGAIVMKADAPPPAADAPVDKTP